MEKMKELYAKTHGGGSNIYRKLIEEEFKEFMAEKPHTHEDFKEVSDLAWVCIMYCIEQGYPLEEGMNELFKEFNSKFYDAQGNYNPQFREDGKLLKGSGFKKANFEQFFK